MSRKDFSQVDLKPWENGITQKTIREIWSYVRGERYNLETDKVTAMITKLVDESVGSLQKEIHDAGKAKDEAEKAATELRRIIRDKSAVINQLMEIMRACPKCDMKRLDTDYRRRGGKRRSYSS